MIKVHPQEDVLRMSGATRLKTATIPRPAERSPEGGRGTRPGCVPVNLSVELGDGIGLHARRAEESADLVGLVMVTKIRRC